MDRKVAEIQMALVLVAATELGNSLLVKSVNWPLRVSMLKHFRPKRDTSKDYLRKSE